MYSCSTIQYHTYSPANGTGSDDQYEVGDLSGRYGNPLNGQTSVGVTEMDSNLPLRGPLSVVGRSIVIHKADSSRWLCGNIVEDTTITKGVMYKAKATFSNGTIQGTITLVSVLSLYHKMYPRGI